MNKKLAKVKYLPNNFQVIEKKWQEHWRDIKLANCDVSLEKNNFYNNRIIKSKRVNLRSKLNQFAFHISNPLLVYIRNFVLKILVKNKKFLDSYLGKVYKN